MAKILYIGTSGSNDPTQAVLPLIAARGALEAEWANRDDTPLVNEKVAV